VGLGAVPTGRKLHIIPGAGGTRKDDYTCGEYKLYLTAFPIDGARPDGKPNTFGQGQDRCAPDRRRHGGALHT